MGKHFNKVCQYGKSHGTCRCPGPKETLVVPCDRPDRHRPPAPAPIPDLVNKVVETSEPEVLTPRTLRDRLSESLTSKPPFAPLDEVLDGLEEAVKDWLREAALNEFTRNEHIR